MSANIFEFQKKKQDEEFTRDLQPQSLQRELDAPSDYPVDALGSILGGAVLAISRGLQCPQALAAQSILAAAALAVQPFANVSIDGREFPLSENFLTLGVSGERKTAVDRIALEPHRLHEKQMRDVYREDVKAFQSEKRAYDASVQKAMKSDKKGESKATAQDFLKAFNDQGIEPIAPLEPFLLVEEPTYQGLMRLLINGQPSIGLFSDEAGQFLGGHAMSKDNKMATITGLSKLWDGSPIDRIRVGDGADKIYGRRLSVHLMTQPIIGLEMLNDDLMKGQGILARVLTTYPESTIGTRLYSSVNVANDPAVRRYANVITQLLKTPFKTSEADPQELEPRLLTLDNAAKKAWVKLHDAVEVAMLPKGKLSGIHPFASKAPEHAARLAGILALTENVNTGVISLRHIEAAWQLIEHYINEALRLTTGSAPDIQLIQAAKLGEWLADHKAGLDVCLQQIYRESITLARSAKTARHLMKILCEHDWTQRQPDDVKVTYREKQVGEVYRIASFEALQEVLNHV